MRLALFLLLLLSGCRYTFWPPFPPEQPTPSRQAVVAEVVSTDRGLAARVRILALAEPGYVRILWYRERELVFETFRFVEGPGELTVPLPAGEPGAYRLEVRRGGKLLAAALYGEPRLPEIAPGESKGS